MQLKKTDKWFDQDYSLGIKQTEEGTHPQGTFLSDVSFAITFVTNCPSVKYHLF